ncbi:STT3 domain-containing protein [Thermocrinis sp.]|uniref:STT3 domain-containing protein n=1 Tax=Thermocrinis sp. TaxID=2024383 RepID=UPI002FDC8EB4
MLHRINWALALALAFSFLFALLPHILEIRQYFKNQDLFFLDGKPFIQNPDGYFFGRLAKEWAEGGWEEMDDLRNFPEDGIKYKYIPLISFIYGSLIKLTGLPLEWVGFWFSPILGSLFVIPLVLFWYFAGNLLLGFGTAIITALSSAYLMRVFVLDIDTDSMNLFFIFSIALFLLLSYKNMEKRRAYLYCSLALLFSFLFYWWYAHTEFFVLSFLGFWLLVWKSGRLFLFSIFGFLVLWVGISYMTGYFLGLDILYRLFLYFGFNLPVVESQTVPEVLRTIGEQSKVTFLRTSTLYFSSEIPFYIALFSFPLFLLRYIKTNLLLLPLFVLFLFAILHGNNRLYLYVSPIIGASFVYGVYLISKLKSYMEKKSLKLFVSYAFPLLMLFIAINWLSLLDRFPGHFISKEVVKDLKKLKELTPEGSKILTWWDYGYAIAYYSKRVVFHDGGSQFSTKTPLIAYGFMNEEKKAYRIFSCVSDPVFNLKAFQQVKEKGLFKALEGIVEYCKKAPHPRIYLLITEDMISKSGAISYLGIGKSFSILKLPRCNPPNCKEYIKNDEGLYIQNFNGSPTEYQAKEIIIIDQKAGIEKVSAFNNAKGTIYLVKKGGETYGFFIPERLKKSSLITLYTIRKDREGFRLVYDNFPYTVLYEITLHKQPQSLQ